MKDFDFDETVSHAVRAKARLMKMNRAFRDYEVEDLESELYLELCARAKDFDAGRSPKMVFVHLVLRGKAARLLRHCTRQGAMSWRDCLSLNVMAGREEDGTVLTVADLTEDRTAFAQFADRDTDMDCERFAEGLTDELRDAFTLLRQHDRYEDAAACMNLPLSTFRDRYLKPLRDRLTAFRGRSASPTGV